MHNTESAEMYLESILVLTQKQGALRAIDVVHHTGYSKPSVSRAMGLLKKNGNIIVDQNGYIILTEQGKEIAAKILERHRVLTCLLVKLGVDDETAAEDACRIEHVISDVSFQKLKEYLQCEDA
ncbi:MAG: metal-dependent transcriptional regulator [Clostridia bacterium]|nr:metal-dependent transcriptional regulator [Clostridia bacterium]